MNFLSNRCAWRSAFSAFVVLSSIHGAQLAQAQSSASCGDLSNAYGPYDFRTDKDKLPIVLGAHFKPEVEALVRGTTSGTPGGDIDYTLRAIPNHPGALLAMIRLGVKEKSERPRGVNYTVECWLERALRFRPDDNLVRMIYANYLGERKRKVEALKHLEIAAATAGDNPFTHYNLGMIYADLKEYSSALKHAHLAMGLGIRQTALSDKLKAAGQWQEMPAEPVTSSVPSASDSGASGPALPATEGQVSR